MTDHSKTDILSFCQNPQVVESLMARRRRLAYLLDRGVLMPCPESVELGPEVDLERIAPGVVLHAGTKLLGPKTWLGPGVRLGMEGPVTLVDSVLGPDVVLDGGFFQGVTCLDRANARSWAHMREGTLLEEEASVAHCVGLKQTILFPFATLGSLINFCDCLLAGGTSRKDHSEVGSGYIHFNFTPRGDKATPSLFGDVPQGVLLNQPRIFLGGLAATVGPTSVGYGAFLGPGQVYRREVEAQQFVLGEPPLPLHQLSRSEPFDPVVLTGVSTRVRRNLRYLGNLMALSLWYRHVRPLFATGAHQIPYASATELVSGAIRERIGQLDKFMKGLPASIQALQKGLESGGTSAVQDSNPPLGVLERARVDQQQWHQRWPALKDWLDAWEVVTGDEAERDALLTALSHRVKPGAYVQQIQSLPPEVKSHAERWLSSVVVGVINR